MKYPLKHYFDPVFWVHRFRRWKTAAKYLEEIENFTSWIASQGYSLSDAGHFFNKMEMRGKVVFSRSVDGALVYIYHRGYEGLELRMQKDGMVCKGFLSWDNFDCNALDNFIRSGMERIMLAGLPESCFSQV